MKRITAFLLALLLPLGGCFHYVPVGAPPRQGTPVQLKLTEPISVRLPEVTATNVMLLRGEMIAAEPTRLLISAFALESGERELWAHGQSVAVPSAAVGQISVKRVSILRTSLAGAALAAGALFIRWGLQGAGGGGDSGGGSPPAQ